MSTYLPNPQIAPLVADMGSHSTKLGYAGEDHPGAIFLSSTAALRSNSSGGDGEEGAATASASGSCFVGKPQRDFATRPLDKDGTDGNYSLVNPVDPTTGWLFSPPDRLAVVVGDFIRSKDRDAGIRGADEIRPRSREPTD